MGELKTLMTGIAFGESPRWHDGRLWFADWGAGEIIAVDADGKSEVIVEVASVPLCFDWLPDGRLLVVSGTRLLRQEGTELVTHADLSGPSTDAWNDIAVDSRGNAYVGNIGFAFPGGEFKPGILARVSQDGTVARAADGVAFPNGMAVTPDDSTLILAESYGNRLTAFDIAADGGLSNRRVWAETPGDHPDGICLDASGAVWYGDVGNQHCVRVREGGEVLQTVTLDRGCFACALGGPDGRTLFMIANRWGGEVSESERTGQVVTARVEVPGADFRCVSGGSSRSVGIASHRPT
jgi:sugar lactone lactonase YvrE